MKFSNTIKTVLKIYQKYAKFSVWFGTGSQTNGNRAILVIYQTDTKARDAQVTKALAREHQPILCQLANRTMPSP